MPRFLADEGYCQMACSWAQESDQDWQAALAAWFTDCGCDVLVLFSQMEDVADYALQRVQERYLDPDEIASQFERWMAYYGSQRIEAVGSGLLTMRRTVRGTPFFSCQQVSAPPCGDAVERYFRSRDFLARVVKDRALLKCRLRPAGGLQWRQQYKLDANGWSRGESRIQSPGALAPDAHVAPAVAEFINWCSGNRPIGEYLKQQAPSDAHLEQFAKVVRDLIARGLLIPAEDG
jgi:hypothetical protein